jgi:hypothetical protein
MVSQHMCSKTCPCAEKVRNVDVFAKYTAIEEETLNKLGRTKLNKEGMIPFDFSGSYVSFSECLKDNFDKAKIEDNNFNKSDILDKFKIDFEQILVKEDKSSKQERPISYIGPRHEAIQNKSPLMLLNFKPMMKMEN